MPNLRRVGREAEDLAADMLIAKGYTIVTRRFKASHGEIDLVALDGDLPVFVEVKWRRGRDARPEDALDTLKMEHIHEAAKEYLLKMGEPERAFRCDLVVRTSEGMRHYEDAFRGGGRMRRFPSSREDRAEELPPTA